MNETKSLSKSIQTILKDNFIQNNIVFFFGSLIVSALNYLYYPVLGRVMNVEDFGEVQAIISILLQTSIIFAVFSYLKINILTNYKNEEEKKDVLLALEKIALILSGVIFLFILASSVFLKEFLHFQSFYPFVALAFLLPLSVPLTFRNAYMISEKKFSKSSVAGAMSAVGKTVFTLMFIYLGFRTLGAVTGLILSQIVAILYLSYQKNGNFSLIPISALKSSMRSAKTLKKEIKKGFFILIILVSATFFFTSDVIFVRIFFSSTESGLYSGIATVARIIYFVTGSVSVVLLSSVKVGERAKNIKILKRSFSLILMLGGGCLAAFSLFPDFVIDTLIGSKFVVYSGLLPWLSLSLFLTAILNLLFVYHIALQRYMISIFVLAGVLMIFLLSVLNHDTITAVIFNFIISNIFVFVLLFGWEALKELKKNGSKTNLNNNPPL
ncbi:hypothetical protein C4544_05005 [candidate division WS5 bacterium]|uniref:Polysaccharide biosynthesis protein n=1 Tax=candidate division WS5 bacterium TaxID=2093353 RepID=A0A419DBR0_9BACT|nr:MAG: hypothetical protein C4544_05005 [candidate division WS5 bacterium]